MSRNPAENGLYSISSSPAEAVLARAQSGREIVQNFVPLADSLEWQLGQEYLRQRGNKAFLSDVSPVPFVVNNDGTLSRHAAEVFFTSLEQANCDGHDEEIIVLELGIGVGLFARYFLDHMHRLCRERKKSYYDRLCYIAADRSERMLEDLLRNGILANHPGRYCVRLVDAMEPEAVLRERARPLHAVFLNYLLDCLPAAVLEVDGESAKQLSVRTCVARSVRLSDFTDLTLQQLRERGESKSPQVRQELLDVYGLFASEYDDQTVDLRGIPYGEFARQFARQSAKRILHSYGAIHSLEKLLPLVADDGFILMNDYGPTQTNQEDQFEHQRFSLATFIGVNFPLLKAFFGDSGRGQWIEPAGESRGIHSRLLGQRVALETVVAFHRCFDVAAQDRLQKPMVEARECVRTGRFELAATRYHEAVRLQPTNWVLLNEVSAFLTFHLRDPKAGADMAKVALDLNPRCSADLWNALGDALYEQGRTAEARSAYEAALEVNDTDVRARFNLAFVHMREKDYPAALVRLAEAMGHDKTGTYRERILQKQQEVLHHLTLRHQQEYLLLTNLVSKYAKVDVAAETAPAPDLERKADVAESESETIQV